MVSSIDAFLSVGQDQIALEIAKTVTNNFSDYYGGWEALSRISITPPPLRQKSIEQMIRLDPLRIISKS